MRAIIAALILFPFAASAAPITFQLDSYMILGRNDPLFADAQNVSLIYTYESTAPDLIPGDPKRGLYDALLGVSVFVDDMEFVASSWTDVSISEMVVGAGYVTQNHGFQAVVHGHDRDLFLQFYALALDYLPPGVWLDDSLPTAPPITIPHETRVALREGTDINGAMLLNSLATSWKVVSVPEPGPLALMLMGLGGIFFSRRAALKKNPRLS